MTPSPLQLERHFFSKVHLDANLEADAKAANSVECDVEVGESKDDPLRFQVMLKLKLLPADGRIPPYTGEFHAVGFYRVDERWPEERRSTLVETNGAALLYGALREAIITLTARGPWPAVTLESVTFYRTEGATAKPQESRTVSKPAKSLIGPRGGREEIKRGLSAPAHKLRDMKAPRKAK